MGTWTDKKIEKLKMLWEKGIPTAEIGKRLDFSKNAIVGKVHRLGLSNRNSPIKTTGPVLEKTKKTTVKKVQEEKSSISKKTKVLPSKSTHKEVENKHEIKAKSSPKNESQKNIDNLKQSKKAVQEGVSLMELASDRCCWPIDDPNSGEFHFCGRKVFKNKPYCLEHCAMAYTTSSSKSAEVKRETDKEKEKDTE